MPLRPLPASLELEQALLGALLWKPQHLAEVVPVLSPDDFYNPDHQKVFAVLKRRYESNKPIEAALLVDDGIKGTTIHKLLANAGIGVHDYVGRLKKLSQLRHLIALTNQLQQKAFEGDETALDEVKTALSQLETTTPIEAKPEPILKLFDAYIARYEEEQKKELIGVPSGFASLDAHMGGFRAGEYILLAARPNVGKTSLALCFALAAAKAQKLVLFGSAEMDAFDLLDRLLAIHGGLNALELRDRKVDTAKVKEVLAELSVLPLFLLPLAGKTSHDLDAAARFLQRKEGLDLVVVDYVQKLSDKEHTGNENLRIAAISHRLQLLAKQLQVPVIALSQLSRFPERENRLPTLADLRDSGALEADADWVLMLHRDLNAPEPEKQNETVLMIQKARKGKRGKFSLVFDEVTTGFWEANSADLVQAVEEVFGRAVP